MRTKVTNTIDDVTAGHLSLDDVVQLYRNALHFYGPRDTDTIDYLTVIEYFTVAMAAA